MKHYTTIEQSEKLLELGLNPESADMTYCAVVEGAKDKTCIKGWEVVIATKKWEDLPVDTLKIDKEFTKYIETNKVHENIVKTICALGNALDLNLICEGVETQEQSDMVKKMGCRVIQGWLIGKAMPYDDAVELLEKYNTKSKK